MTLKNIQNNITKIATSNYKKEDVAFYSANISQNGAVSISINIPKKEKLIEFSADIDKDINDFIKNVKNQIKEVN